MKRRGVEREQEKPLHNIAVHDSTIHEIAIHEISVKGCFINKYHKEDCLCF